MTTTLGAHSGSTTSTLLTRAYPMGVWPPTQPDSFLVAIVSATRPAADGRERRAPFQLGLGRHLALVVAGAILAHAHVDHGNLAPRVPLQIRLPARHTRPQQRTLHRAIAGCQVHQICQGAYQGLI